MMLRNPCKPCIVKVVCSRSCYKLDIYTNNLKMIKSFLRNCLVTVYVLILIGTFAVGFAK